MNNKKFSINVEGIEYNYEILKLLNSNKFNSNYIIYTDGKDTYASKYNKLNNNIVLEDIESDAEWEYIDSFFDENGGLK